MLQNPKQLSSSLAITLLLLLFPPKNLIVRLHWIIWNIILVFQLCHLDEKDINAVIKKLMLRDWEKDWQMDMGETKQTREGNELSWRKCKNQITALS